MDLRELGRAHGRDDLLPLLEGLIVQLVLLLVGDELGLLPGSGQALGPAFISSSIDNVTVSKIRKLDSHNFFESNAVSNILHFLLLLLFQCAPP